MEEKIAPPVKGESTPTPSPPLKGEAEREGGSPRVMDIDYTIGGVGKIKYARYFTVDPLERDIIKRGDPVLYTDFKRGRVIPLFIDLEGWDLKGQVRFYF